MAAWSLLLLVIPGALMLRGDRPVNLEGAAPPPAPRFEPKEFFNVEYFAGIRKWFSFNQPMRDNAIAANAWLDTKVLGDQPTPTVVVGEDGWYFTADDADRYACTETDRTPQIILADIDQLHAEAAAAGIDFYAIMSPDKSPIERAHRPSGDPDLACILKSNDDMRATIGASAKPWRPDLWTVMDEVKSDVGSVFYKSDSHMNPAAETELVKATINAVQPGLWDDGVVTSDGVIDRPTDLTRQIGLPANETQPNIRVERPGVTTTPDLTRIGVDDVADSFVTYRSTGAAMVPGKTVILHDSQFVMAASQLAPWFSDVTFINWNLWGDPRIPKTISEADTLIVESVQRAVPERMSPPLIDVLRKAIAQR